MAQHRTSELRTLAGNVVALCVLVLGHVPAHGANFCVSTAVELQTALDTAESNSADDLVRIVQGTYQGSFVYDATEFRNLTIEGGYVAGCGSRVVNPANTILDGMSTKRVLRLVSSEAANFEIDGLSVRNGYTGSTGGGLYAITSGGITLTNNTINGNLSDFAGGAYLNGDTLTLTNNTISGNLSGHSGGGAYLKGDTVTLTSNIISDNEADGGGGVNIHGSTVVTLTHNTISDNWALMRGGGIAVFGNSTVTLTNNTITDNFSSEEEGGGAYLCGDIITLTNNTIIGNRTITYGGGAYLCGDIITLTNNTITGNRTNTTYGSGGGVFLDLYDDTDTADLYNNIIWGNHAPRGADLSLHNDGNNNAVPSPIRLFHNDFDWSTIHITLPFAIDVSNLNNQNPLFVNPGTGDYHLQVGSPVIDQGDNMAPALPAQDKDGNPRIQGGTVDLGAYEYAGVVPDIEANGFDIPLTIRHGSRLVVTVALNPGGYVGVPADWWVAAASPFGLYWYTLDRGWVRSDAPIRTHGGPLTPLTPYAVLSTTGLPNGHYTFYFGVDLLMNDVLDVDRLLLDSVSVTIWDW